MAMLLVRAVSELKKTKDEKSTYFILTLMEQDDVLGKVVNRGVFRQNIGGTMEFGMGPEACKALLKSQRPIKGEMFNAEVPAYTFKNTAGVEVTATTFRSCTVGSETIDEVVRRNGHGTDQESAPVVSEADELALLGMTDAPIADQVPVVEDEPSLQV